MNNVKKRLRNLRHFIMKELRSNRKRGNDFSATWESGFLRAIDIAISIISEEERESNYQPTNVKNYGNH